jgi:hypothetical protein
VVIYLTRFKPNSNPNPLFIDVSLESPCVADVPYVMYVCSWLHSKKCGWLLSKSWGLTLVNVADFFPKRMTFLQSGWLYFSMWLTFFEWLTSFSKWLAVFEWLTDSLWTWLTAFKVADFFSKRLTFFRCGWRLFGGWLTFLERLTFFQSGWLLSKMVADWLSSNVADCF